MTDAMTLSCDTCGWDTSTDDFKPFDPCPECAMPCDHCERVGDGKMRLMFSIETGKPVPWLGGRP